MNGVSERIRLIVADYLAVHPDQVVPAAVFADDLNADSLDRVDLSMALEEAFGIEPTELDHACLLTVGDLVSQVQILLSQGVHDC